jgi:hypothetical protein
LKVEDQMSVGTRCTPLMVVVLAVAAISSCGDNPASPSDSRSVAGTWDARFEGTVQGQGTPQTDTIVLELQQSGSAVTDTLRFQGLALAIPLTGEVRGSTLRYTATALLGPNCPGTVSAEATIAASNAAFSGSQTQSTCEGTAVGQVTATRR